MAALFTVTYAIANPFASFGVFLPVLAETFGWSRGAISAAMSINLVVGGVIGFVIGALADRHGPRVLLASTVALTGAGFALAAGVETLWQLYLSIGVMAGVGMSGFYVIATATVSRWFTSRRGLALGLVLTGFNLGFMTGGPLAALLIERTGWRVAWVVLGGGFCLVGTLASLLVRYPGEMPHRPGGSRWHGLGSTLVDWRLWALGGSWLLNGFVLLMVSVHVVSFARDQGIALEAASLGITAYGFGAVVGRVVGGVAADRVGAAWVMVCGSLQQAVALTLLVLIPSQAMLLLVLVLFGIGFAGADTSFARVVPEAFGVHALGAIFGVLSLGWRVGSAIGPIVAGFVHDATGSYVIPFATAPFAVLVSLGLFVLVVGGPGRAPHAPHAARPGKAGPLRERRD